MAEIFFEIGIVIIAATMAALLARIFKQPLIVAYVFAGLVLGPLGLGLVTDSEVIRTLAEIGIAFLLFIVGLEIDISRLKDVGVSTLVIGTGQVLATFGLGFLVANLIGFSTVPAVYFGLIASFSSTMIVIKLLSDKKELDTLHGRIILGILLVQDVFAIGALALLPTIGHITAAAILTSLLKGVLLFVIAIVARTLIFPILFKFVAKNTELLFLTSVSWCFIMAMMAYLLNYSIAIGAFLGGVSMASLAYHTEIASKVKSLRDFFATIFFVALGTNILLIDVTSTIIPTLALLGLSLIGLPVIFMVGMSLAGHKRRTAFLTAASLGQVGEFSLIIIALGLGLGHVTDSMASMVALAVVITIIITSYVIKYDDWLYRKLSNPLRLFEKLSIVPKKLLEDSPYKKVDIILCGYDRIGFSILNKLNKLSKSFMIVDFNPSLIKKLNKEKVPCIYGDIGDSEILERLNLRDAEMVISTIPTTKDNLLLIQKAKSMNRRAVLIVTASRIDEALSLYQAGADYVVLPHFLGGDHVSLLIENFSSNFSTVINTRLNHIAELENRQRIRHDHPAPTS